MEKMKLQDKNIVIKLILNNLLLILAVNSELNYPKCPVYNAGTYLHHPYKYYSSFKYNSLFILLLMHFICTLVPLL